MSYTAVATRKTPAFIIYLLDVSGSMSEGDIQLEDGSKATRISVVLKALEDVFVRMIRLSTRGSEISPRYRIAVYAYSSQVYDILGGVKTIDEVAQIGTPELGTMDMTNTEAAFLEIEKLLTAELPNLASGSPAPLVCHMTDGEITMGGDPLPVAQRIMNMSTSDGNILVENIFVSPSAQLVRNPNIDVKTWSGMTSASELVNDHARRLFEMSSPIPASYRLGMQEMGYKGLQDGTRMMFAGNDHDLIKMAFVMSGVTPTK